MVFRPVLIPAVAWLVIATILFCLPGAAFPQQNWMSRIYFDKWVHVGIFSLLCLFWGMALAMNNLRAGRWLLAAAVVYGLAIEVVQDQLIPNRSFDWTDLLADAVGAVLGLWAIRYIKK